LPAHFLHLRKGDEPGLVEVPQTPVIPIDDPFYLGNFLSDLQELIALLLIFGQDKGRIAVVDNVGHFVGGGVGEKAHLHSAGRQHPQIGPQVETIVITHRRHVIASLQAQDNHAQGKGLHPFIALWPGELLPDTKLFLAQSDLVRPIFFHPA
jgi:hypothetical protein